jgi:nitric oxide synthase oxygenase domain/subunit
MDAEIGVRNLADTFRYNYLPRIVKTLGDVKTTEDLEDPPNQERLAPLVNKVARTGLYKLRLILLLTVKGTNRA